MVNTQLVWIAGSPLTVGLHHREVDIARRALEELEAEHPATTPAPEETMSQTVSTIPPKPTVVENLLTRVTELEELFNLQSESVQTLQEAMKAHARYIAELQDKLTELAEQGPRAKPADDTNERLVAYLRDCVPGVWMGPTSIAANLHFDGKAVAGRLDRMANVGVGGVERQGGRGSGSHPLYRVVPPPKPQPES